MADEFIYKESMEDQTTNPSPFLKREYLSLTDTQGGSYSGRIVFDSSRLASSGKWVDLRSAEIHIPFVITAFSSQDNTTAANAFMCGLKNGTHHLIDSMSVRFNNKQVLQETQYLNHHVSFKLMSSFSQDDLKKHGSSYFFSPDTATSFRFNAAASVDGEGITNNRVGPAALTDFGTLGYKGQSFNSGFTDRLRNVTDLSSAGKTDAENLGGLGGNFSDSQAVTKRKSHFVDDGVAAAGRVYVWHILARIKLAHLSDFFERMPLVKSPYLQITIAYNASSQTITTVSAANNTFSIATPTITGNTNPIMIASAAGNNPLNAVLTADNQTIQFNSGVVSVTTNGKTFKNTLQTSCQLVVDAYTMTPSAEREFISTIKEKTVDFTDLNYQYLTELTANGDFSSLVTGNVKRAKRLIVIPYFNKSANTGLVDVPVYQSPLTSEPATTSPMISLTNLQIQVSGVNVWTEPQSYDWDMFKNEISPAYAINGGLSTGLSSGLLSQQDWEIGYRYVVCDLSRRFPADDDTGKSIQISGKIVSDKAVDLLIFIEFERSITVDTATSAVTMIDL